MFDLPPAIPALEITVASRGYSKGMAQTDELQVVVRPEVELGNFRVGAYAKNVTSSDYEAETGAVLSYRAKLGTVELSGSAAFKHAVESRPGVDESAAEFTVAATRPWGRLTPRLALIYSPNDLGATRRSFYWEAGAVYRLTDKWRANGGIGVRGRNGGSDYVSFNAGLARDLMGPFSAEVRWFDTGRHSLGDSYKSRIVAQLRARF